MNNQTGTEKSVRSPPANQIYPKTFNVNGTRTTLALEYAFLKGFLSIAETHDIAPSRLLRRIKHHYAGNNLASAVRTFVLQYYASHHFIDATDYDPEIHKILSGPHIGSRSIDADRIGG